MDELEYGADLGRLVAIEAELIRLQPTATEGARRRLLVERWADGTRRMAVRVTSLRHERCTISSARPIAEFDGNWWLKMPGLEARNVALIGELKGQLICQFAQPLSSAILGALAMPAGPHTRGGSYKRRCSFLGFGRSS